MEKEQLPTKKPEGNNGLPSTSLELTSSKEDTTYQMSFESSRNTIDTQKNLKELEDLENKLRESLDPTEDVTEALKIGMRKVITDIMCQSGMAMGNVELVKKVVDRYPFVEDIIKEPFTDPFGKNTFLNVAIESLQYEIVKFYLELGVDPNLRDSSQNTSLHIAAFEATNFEDTGIDIIKLLLSYGAEANVENAKKLLLLIWE